MDEVQLLDSLYNKYRYKAKETKSWVDYLKAHGLANACLERTNSEEWRQKVYEIEQDWYKGGHPLTYTEHLRTVELNKQRLKQLRKETKMRFDSLGSECKMLDVFDTFSAHNLERMDSIAGRVTELSKEFSDGFVKLARDLFSISVTNLEKIGMTAPCPFAVIGFGSLARGEATPYSDLEYGILIQSNAAGTKYFHKLAVDSYFRIGNFEETPLKCFDIAELKIKDENGLNRFTDSLKCVGLKIDGISRKAGNIPTGNGQTGEYKLIATVDGMVKLHMEELKAPDGDITGDLSDLLSTSVLLYASRGGSNLHRALQNKLFRAYQNCESSAIHTVKKKKVETLVKDIENYNYLPNIQEYATQRLVGNIKVKTDIFRYPTLLATNLRIFFTLKTTYPWETFAKLNDVQILNAEMTQHLQFILAAAIYIRMTAYLTYGSQKEDLSFFRPLSPSNELYYVCQELFVIMGYLLIPIKKTLLSTMKKLHQKTTTNVEELLKNMGSNYSIDKEDYILKANLLLYVGDSHRALQHLISVLGEKAVHDYSTFIEELRRKYGRDTAFEVESTLMCIDILCDASKYEECLRLCNGLIHCERATLPCMMIAAACYFNMQHFQQAVNLYSTILHMSFTQHGIDEYGIIELLEKGSKLSRKTVVIVFIIYKAYCELAKVYTQIDTIYAEKAIYYSKAAKDICDNLEKYQHISWDNARICSLKWMASLQDAYYATQQHRKALDVYECMMEQYYMLLGKNTNHPSIAGCYSSIVRIYDNLDMFDEAVEHCLKALDMYYALYGKDSRNIKIADCHSDLGNVYAHMGRYGRAINHHETALAIRLAVYGSNIKRPEIADEYSKHGTCCRGLKRFDDSLRYHIDALEMRWSIFGKYSNHSSIADTVQNIGSMYYDKLEYNNSLACFTKALKIRKTIFGNKVNHPDLADTYKHIGRAYYGLSKYRLAVEYLERALNMQVHIYGPTGNHRKMLVSYKWLTMAYYVIPDYKKLLATITSLSPSFESTLKSDYNKKMNKP